MNEIIKGWDSEAIFSKEKLQGLNKPSHISPLMLQLKSSWCVIGFVRNRIKSVNTKLEAFSFLLGILLALGKSFMVQGMSFSLHLVKQKR